VLKGPINQGQEAKANPGAPKGQLGSEAPVHGGQAGGSLKLCLKLPLQVALALKHGAEGSGRAGPAGTAFTGRRQSATLPVSGGHSR